MTEDTSPENLRKFLESDDPGMVRMGISIAKGVGVEVTVEDLKHFLKSEDVETVKTGIMLADEAGVGDEAMEMLCEPLGDEEENIGSLVTVRRSTAKALGDIGDKRAVEPLIKALGDEDEDADTVAWALGEIGDARAVEPLIESLIWAFANYGREFAVGAMLALGKIGDARAVEPISDLLNEEGLYIEDREAAAIALGQIGEPAAKSLTGALCNSFSYEFAARALKDIGKPAVESLITALEDDDEYIEWGAKIVEVLGEIGDERAVTRAVKSLIKALGNKNYVDEVRMYAAEALGEIGDKRAVEPLIKALSDDDDWEVRDSAASALGKIGDAQAIEALTKALGDENKYVRKYAKEALKKLGHEVK